MADTWSAINSLLGSRFSDQAAAQTALEKALNAGTSRLGQLVNDDAVAAEPNAAPPVVGSDATTRTAVAADIIDIIAMTLKDIVESNENYDARVAAAAAAAATTAALKPA